MGSREGQAAASPVCKGGALVWLSAAARWRPADTAAASLLTNLQINILIIHLQAPGFPTQTPSNNICCLNSNCFF